MAAASSGSKSKWDDCLSNLGRKVYVSQRGLEGVLKELREHGLLTEEVPASRKSIKRAREDDLAARATRYGPLIQHMDIQHEDGLGRTVRLPYISPAALLSHLAEQPQFGSFLAAALRASPGSYETPWTLCVYADEVSPGNALKPVNWRRQWAVYWSLREFGPDGLACENLWFPLCVLRSHLTSAVGGLTVLWTHALRKFFGAPHNLRAGVLLETPEGQHVLFAKLGILIADEAAIKHSLENKGASGTLFCVRCSNVVPDRTGLNEVSNDVIGSRCLDFSKFKLHSNESTRNAVLFLQEQSTLVGKTRFADLEKALGFNYKPEGLLLDEAVGYAVPEAVMFDWLHIYLVHGVAGNEVGHLLGCLRDAGFPESRLSEVLHLACAVCWIQPNSDPGTEAGHQDCSSEGIRVRAAEFLPSSAPLHPPVCCAQWACRTSGALSLLFPPLQGFRTSSASDSRRPSGPKRSTHRHRPACALPPGDLW